MKNDNFRSTKLSDRLTDLYQGSEKYLGKTEHLQEFSRAFSKAGYSHSSRIDNAAKILSGAGLLNNTDAECALEMINVEEKYVRSNKRIKNNSAVMQKISDLRNYIQNSARVTYEAKASPIETVVANQPGLALVQYAPSPLEAVVAATPQVEQEQGRDVIGYIGRARPLGRTGIASWKAIAGVAAAAVVAAGGYFFANKFTSPSSKVDAEIFASSPKEASPNYNLLATGLGQPNNSVTSAANHELEMQKLILEGTHQTLVVAQNELEAVIRGDTDRPALNDFKVVGSAYPGQTIAPQFGYLHAGTQKVIEAGRRALEEVNREAAIQGLAKDTSMWNPLGLLYLQNDVQVAQSRIPTGLDHDSNGRLVPVYDPRQLSDSIEPVIVPAPVYSLSNQTEGAVVLGSPVIDVDTFDIVPVTLEGPANKDVQTQTTFSLLDEAKFIDAIVTTEQFKALPTLSKPILYGTVDLANNQILEMREKEPLLHDTFIDRSAELLAIANGFAEIAPVGLSNAYTFDAHARQMGVPDSFIRELEGDVKKVSSLDNLIALANYAGRVKLDRKNTLNEGFIPIGDPTKGPVKFIGGIK